MAKHSSKAQKRNPNTFWSKYKDPRWQKKRLEVMERDQWKCQSCRKKSETLNVHHRNYIKGLDPWAYENPWLVTLCEACHKDEHKCKDFLHSQMAEAGLSYRQLLKKAGLGLPDDKVDASEISAAFNEMRALLREGGK